MFVEVAFAWQQQFCSSNGFKVMSHGSAPNAACPRLQAPERGLKIASSTSVVLLLRMWRKEEEEEVEGGGGRKGRRRRRRQPLFVV